MKVKGRLSVLSKLGSTQICTYTTIFISAAAPSSPSLCETADSELCRCGCRLGAPHRAILPLVGVCRAEIARQHLPMFRSARSQRGWHAHARFGSTGRVTASNAPSVQFFYQAAIVHASSIAAAWPGGACRQRSEQPVQQWRSEQVLQQQRQHRLGSNPG